MCVALIGCAAEREVVRPTVGISGEDFRKGGVAVGGVTVVDEVEQVRPPLVAAFERTLATDRPDLPFRRADSVRVALGLPEYRRLLNAYQSTGNVGAADLAALKEAIGPGTRYLILGRVEKNAVRAFGRMPSHARHETWPPPPANQVLSASRDARVRFTLYDLAEGRSVFEAAYASSSDNSLPDSLRNAPPPRPAVTVGGDQVGEPPEPPPDLQAPELSTTLLEAYHAFLADLPR
jgi:hypothetical protein